MAALNAQACYQNNQVSTAGRGQLLLMAYDGMLRFLTEAKRAMLEGDLEAQGTNIAKTQALVLELLCTLDHQAYPLLADNLDQLYRYMYDRLTWANVHDDTVALAEVVRHLHELREAWAEADRLSRMPERTPALVGV
jgi:flagellar protein FliS